MSKTSMPTAARPAEVVRDKLMWVITYRTCWEGGSRSARRAEKVDMVCDPRAVVLGFSRLDEAAQLLVAEQAIRSIFVAEQVLFFF